MHIMAFKYFKNANYMILIIIGLILLTNSYLIYKYNPLEMLIIKATTLKANSVAFFLWKNPPYDIHAKIYIFNVTNAEQFLKGDEKLQVEEKGPYVYKEQLYSTNIKFNQDRTISFTPKRMLTFIPELSVGDPKIDTLQCINIPLLGITASLQDNSMLIKVAVAQISNVINSKPFLNLTINDYLFGYDDTLVTLANNVVPNWIDFPRFGIIDRLMALDNGSYMYKMQLDPSTDSEAFSIDTFNESPGLFQWGYNDHQNTSSNCNLIKGCYLGTIFPPNIDKKLIIRLYRHGFCRPIPIHYKASESTKDGFDSYLFKVSHDFLATPKENPDNQCYCSSKNCLPKGLNDMAPCYYGIPVALSQPHFLNGDPSLLHQVKGLAPDPIKHDFSMRIHPPSGLPLEAKLRIQINLAMPNTRFNSRTKPFNNLIIPLFWVELVVEAPPKKIKLLLRLLYHILPVTQEVLMYICGLMGFALILYSIALIFASKRNHRDYLELNINYSEIPVFPLKQKLKTSEM